MSDIIKDNVQFIGLNELHPLDQQRIKDIIYSEFEKLEREFKHIEALRVHFKPFNKQGPSKKYSVHMFLAGPSSAVTAEVDPTLSAVFNPVKAIHMALEKLRTILIHKFQGDATKPKFSRATKEERFK